MIARISRYLIILIFILIAAIFLPDLYWLSFSKPTRSPYVAFSPLTEDFIIGKIVDRKFTWVDKEDNKYSMADVDSLLPFTNYRQLASKGKLPDSIRGIKVDIEEIRLNGFLQRIKPSYIDPPRIPLYPLFEANPPRLELEMPETFFRITDRMEFIDAASNTIVDSLTISFTNALQSLDFNFPAKLVAGNPTTRKPFDEGYFVIDNKGKMFHIKMYDGKPIIKNTQKPEDIDVREIFVSERNLREFYGLLISRKNEIYFILYDEYKLQKLPVDDYIANQNILRIQGNLLYRLINIRSDNTLKTLVTDRNYQLIATSMETWPGKYDGLAGKIVNYIFPFTINLHNSKSAYINFYHRSYSFTALYVNLILVLIFFAVNRRSDRMLAFRTIDAVIILVSGIYGFLAVLLVPDSDN